MPLVTQTIDDKPTLVLLGESSLLRDQIKQICQRNNLEVIVVANKASLAAAVANPAVYKVVWVLTAAESRGEWSQLAQVLLNSKIPVMVVHQNCTAFPENGDFSNWKNWFRESEQSTSLREWLDQFGSWSTVALLDVVTDHTVLGWGSDWWRQLAQKKKILVSEILVAPQTISAAVIQLTPLLLSPWRPAHVLIRGRRRTLTQLGTELVRQIKKSHHLTIEAIKDELQPTGQSQVTTDPTKEISSTQSLEEVVQALASTLPEHLKSQIPTPSSPVPTPVVAVRPVRVSSNSSSGPSVSQTPLPNVLNRHVAIPPKPLPRTPIVTRAAVPSSDEQLHQKLETIFTDKRVDHKVTRVTKLAEQKQTFQKKTRRKTRLFWVGTMVVGAAVGMLLLAGVWWGSERYTMRQLAKVAQSGQPFSQTQQETVSNLVQAAQILRLQTDAYQTVLSSEWFHQSNKLIEMSSLIQNITTSVETLDTVVAAAYRQAVGGEVDAVYETLEGASAPVQSLYQSLSQLEASFDQLDQSKLSASELAQLQSFVKTLQDQRRSLATLQQVQPLLPELMGKSGKKTYAVVLQNNQELRPTGGFIQSVAFVTVDRGAIIDYQVNSVYDLEKNTVGELKPPAPITQYLGESNWFFHDSNWDPDFTRSAERMSWFLQKLQNRPVDGVIAVDLYTLANLIKATGPVELSKYNETLTDKNIFERAEYHSELQLVDDPNTTDYLSAVLEQVLRKLQSLPADKTADVLGALYQGFDQQHALIYTAEPNVLATLQGMGWAGNLVSPNCPAQLAADGCVVDTFYQVEANVGVNKANQYIKRTIEQTITLSEQRIDHLRRVTFQNTATTNAWPRGAYKNYLRFYLPQEANVTGLSIDGVEQKGNSWTITEEDGRRVVSLLVEVPIQAQKTIEIKYSLNLKLVDKSTYAFFEQKQPGTGADPLTITINHPGNLVPTVIAPQAEVKNQSILFQFERAKHIFVGAHFEARAAR
jgi:hypothetical protein